MIDKEAILAELNSNDVELGLYRESLDPRSAQRDARSALATMVGSSTSESYISSSPLPGLCDHRPVPGAVSTGK